MTLTLFIGLMIAAQPVLSKNTLPVFQIDTTDKTGFQIGQALGRAAKQQFPDIEARYDAYLHKILTQAQFDQMLAQQVNRIRSQVGATYQDEITGITSRWQLFGHDQLGDGRLSLHEYWTFLLLPDLGKPGIRGSAFGVWHTASASGSPMIGRNLDWPDDANLGDLQALTVYTGPDSRLVTIGFAGHPGVLTGFNQSGLFLAQIASPEPTGATGSDSVTFALRRTLETTQTTHQATGLLSRYRYTTGHSIVMADRAHIQVLEIPQNAQARIRTNQSLYRADKPWQKADQIAVVNCYALASSPDNCTHSRDHFLWQRFSQLAAFDRQRPAETSDIIRIMLDQANRHQAIFNQDTLQALVFTPEDGTLNLYHRPFAGSESSSPVMQTFHRPSSTKPAKSWDPAMILLIILSACLLAGVVYYLEYCRKR